MERAMTDIDKRAYMELMKGKITNNEVLDLIKNDLDYGLTDVQINDYVRQGFTVEQMKNVSYMYRKKYPMEAIAVIGGTGVEAERMKVAIELYENGVDIDSIKKSLNGTQTARDMRLAFANVLGKVQEVLAVTPDKVLEDTKQDDEIKTQFSNIPPVSKFFRKKE